MHLRSLKVISIVLGSMFLVSNDYSEAASQDGYTSVTWHKDVFLAAGSEGRIDRISISGNKTNAESFPGVNFNCIISDNENVIAAGDKGILMISTSGKSFSKVESGTSSDINSVAIFNGKIIAGADNGEIIIGDPAVTFKTINLNLRGNIVSLSAGLSACYGVTDAGEIIHSNEGTQWEIFDFNQTYTGFYRPCSFTSVLVTQNRIVVAGKQDDGAPVVAFSSQGNVWTERILSYTDDSGFREFLTAIPNSIVYDESTDQYFLACNNGSVLLLPSCSQCNKVTKVSDADLKSLSFNGSRMLIVGADYFSRIMDLGL